MGSLISTLPTAVNSSDSVESSSALIEPDNASNRATTAAWASRLAERISVEATSGANAAGAIDSNSSRNLSTVAD